MLLPVLVAGDGNGTSDVFVTDRCLGACQLYGDVFPVGPPTGNCLVDVDDILCGLDGYFDAALCPTGDIFPCGGDGVIDDHDIQAILDAFAGVYQCPHTCAP